MNTKRLFAIGFILVCTACGWAILGTSLSVRTAAFSEEMGQGVQRAWGPPMTQQHPAIFYNSPSAPNGRKYLQPAASDVKVALNYEPKKKGLLWYRTYVAEFNGTYTIENPTPVSQTLYVRFQFPSESASYTNFSFVLNDKSSTEATRAKDGISDAVTLAPGEKATLNVQYMTRGVDRWVYAFGDAPRVRNFQLTMLTDFKEINFPGGTGSPTDRKQSDRGWELHWSFPDVIGAQSIGMDMPSVLNPGPVAARISFFAPVSLLFFFAVLVIAATVMGVNLHPMNYFFLAAGCFSFQLLFAYLVDLIPLHVAFAIAATVSLTLVSGYLTAVAGKKFGRLAATAQFTYMVLFSYSFFFEGLSGLTIAIGAIITLAVLMITTARVNWTMKFASTPPPLPVAVA
ncbi:MAG: inner membrane CreD family protein [Chthoniobacterales bacterium]